MLFDTWVHVVQRKAPPRPPPSLNTSSARMAQQPQESKLTRPPHLYVAMHLLFMYLLSVTKDHCIVELRIVGRQWGAVLNAIVRRGHNFVREGAHCVTNSEVMVVAAVTVSFFLQCIGQTCKTSCPKPTLMVATIDLLAWLLQCCLICLSPNVAWHGTGPRDEQGRRRL